MLAAHPVSLVPGKERAVSENYARRRFETLPGKLDEGFENSRPMIFRGDCEVDEYDGVAGVRVCAPCTVCSQFMERGWNLEWIASNIKPYCFKNSCDRVVDVSSRHVTAGIRDSLAPRMHISRGEPFPVFLENAHTGFTLDNLLAATKC